MGRCSSPASRVLAVALAASSAMLFSACGGGGGAATSTAPSPAPAPIPAPPPVSSGPPLLGADVRVTSSASGASSGFARLALFEPDTARAQPVHSFSAAVELFWSYVYSASRSTTPGLFTNYRVRAVWLFDAGAVRYLDLDQVAQGARRVSTLTFDDPQTALCQLETIGSTDITDPLTSRALVKQAGADAQCNTRDDISFVVHAAQTENSRPAPVPTLAQPEALRALEKPNDRASKQDWLAWLEDGRIVVLNDDLDVTRPVAELGRVQPGRSWGLEVIEGRYPSGRIAVSATNFDTTTSLLVIFDREAKTLQRTDIFDPGLASSGRSPSIAPSQAGSYVVANGSLAYWPYTSASSAPITNLPAEMTPQGLVPIDGGVIVLGQNRRTMSEVALLVTDAGARATPLPVTLNTLGGVFASGDLISVFGSRNNEFVLRIIDRSGVLVRETAGTPVAQRTLASVRDFRSYDQGGAIVFARVQGSRAPDLIALDPKTGLEVNLGTLPAYFRDATATPLLGSSAALPGARQVLRFNRRVSNSLGATEVADDAFYADLQTPNSLRRLTNNINF